MAKKQEQALVDKFNTQYPVGSKLQYRRSKNSEYEEVTVRHAAYLAASGNAVAFFEEISGFCSISSLFVKYQ